MVQLRRVPRLRRGCVYVVYNQLFFATTVRRDRCVPKFISMRSSFQRWIDKKTSGRCKTRPICTVVRYICICRKSDTYAETSRILYDRALFILQMERRIFTVLEWRINSYTTTLSWKIAPDREPGMRTWSIYREEWLRHVFNPLSSSSILAIKRISSECPANETSPENRVDISLRILYLGTIVRILRDIVTVVGRWEWGYLFFF